MRLLSIPLMILALQKPAINPPPPVQICLFQQPTGGVSVGTCPAPVIGPQGPAGPAGPQGLQGIQGIQGPPGTGGSNLPPSVAASTLPQNSLGIVMADGTVIPLSIVNPTSGTTVAQARMAVVTPPLTNAGLPLIVPVFSTSYSLPGKPYLQANIAGWQPAP